MKKLVSVACSLALASVLALPAATYSEAGSKRECRAYAERKADRKTSRRVVRNLVIGGLVGGVFGSIVGGRKTTALGAVGGAGAGIVIGDRQWRTFYKRAYADCRARGRY
jgi:uncharacterized protein YcfJ